MGIRSGISVMLFLTGLMTCAAQSGVEAREERSKMNVLFVIVDDLRSEIGSWGYDYMITPNLDRLATTGMRFTRTYCQQALCHPSRNSVLSGLRPDALTGRAHCSFYREAWPDIVSLPQHFKNQGYYTRSIGKVLHHNGLPPDNTAPQYDPISWSEPMFWPKTGIYALRPDIWTRCQLERWQGIGLPKEEKSLTECADVPDDAYRDGMVATETIRTLRRVKNQPFFLAVGFYKPHTPFAAPKKYWDRYDPHKIKLASNPHAPTDAPAWAVKYNWNYIRRFRDIPDKGPMPDEIARHLLHGYHAAITYMDAQLGRVLDELDRLDLADETVVVLWSDHGYQMGEHGIWGKHTNFEEAVLTPMIMRVPGQTNAGQACGALVELVDLYPSLCDFAGLELPDHLEGTSFIPLLNTPDRAWKSAAFSQYPRQKVMGRSMRTERYRYTAWRKQGDGKVLGRELYDHDTDPKENTNLAADPAKAFLIQQLEEQLQSGWKAALPE
jgi:iduronate 2-sulfatase